MINMSYPPRSFAVDVRAPVTAGRSRRSNCALETLSRFTSAGFSGPSRSALEKEGGQTVMSRPEGQCALSPIYHYD